MPFSARTAATIRDVLLGRWRARYLALTPPRDLSITEGSDAYNLADAFAHELAGLELGAQQAAMRVLIRTSSGADLDRFAEDDGTARRAATTARLSVRVSGPSSSTTPVGGATLASSAALRFTPIDADTGAVLTSIVTDGAGVADITVEAVDAGALGNLAAGTVLTWSSAPTGFAATGSITAASRLGLNAESDAALRQRLLERLREKPGGFNRSQIRELGILFAGVGECFVYCRARRMLAALPVQFDYPGVVTIMPVNPAPADDSYTQSGVTTGQGLSAAYNRVSTSNFAGQLLEYFKGERDVLGTAVPEALRQELIPASMLPSNLFSLPPEEVVVPVTVRVTLDPSVAVWPWGLTGSAARLVTASTTTYVDVDDATGIAAGTRIAVKLGRGFVRGGWWLATVLSVVANRITFTSALPTAPSPDSDGDAYVRPDPGLWDAIRRAVLMLFDSLGPGDARDDGTVSAGLITGGTLNVPSGRYPRPTTASSPETLFTSRISQAVQAVDGVLGVTVYEPSVDRTPAPGRLLVPGQIIVTPPT